METAVLLKSSGFNWRTLLQLAVAGNLVILLYMMIALGDTLAWALAIVRLAGLGLIRFHSGMLGILLIGPLCADTAVWAVSGTVGNFPKWRETVRVNPPRLFGDSLPDRDHGSHRHLDNSRGARKGFQGRAVKCGR